MHCPTCKTEIKHPDTIQCPECKTFLLDLPEEEKAADIEGGPAGTTDVVDSFLEGITSEVERILTSDQQEAAKKEPQTDAYDEPASEDPEKVIELTDDIESGAEAAEAPQPTPEEPDEIESGAEAAEAPRPAPEEPDDIESGAEAVETAQPASEEPDDIIELTDPIEPKEVIQKVDQEEPDNEIGPVSEPETDVAREDELIVEQPEDDVAASSIQKTLFPEDDEKIEEMSEKDIEPVEAPKMEVAEDALVEAPPKSKRSSKTLPVLAGAALLVVAAVLGGKVFIPKQPKPVPSQTTSPKIATPSKEVTSKQAVRVAAEKAVAENKESTVPETQTKKKSDVQPRIDGGKEAAVERKTPDAAEKREPQEADTEKAAPSVVAEKKSTPPIAAAPPDTDRTPSDEVVKVAPFYTIQLGSFKKRALADAEVARLKPKGYLAYIIPRNSLQTSHREIRIKGGG
jgi:hypothetical protein